MFAWIRAKLKGCKTLVAAAGVIGLGLLSVAGTIDLQPLIAYFVSDDKQRGAIMVVLGLMFGALRFATTTSVLTGSPALNADAGLPPPPAPAEPQMAPVKALVDVPTEA